MTSIIGNGTAESQSTNRHPLFHSTNYTYWKARMKIYVQANYYDAWKSITKGIEMPIKIEEGEVVPKLEEEYNEDDIKKAQSNAKVMNLLYYALSPTEFNRISGYDIAREIWDMLQVTHEGTDQVKETRIDMLVHSYELFKMKFDEFISEMFTRFPDIFNNLKFLAKTYPNHEIVRKILKCFPKEWKPKVTVIQESKNFKTLALDELVGSLITYEIELKEKEDERDDSDEDDELTFITRRYNMLMKRKFLKKKSQKKMEESQKKESIICYECKKPSHNKPKCPLLKKSKKKAMVAAWPDSEESEQDDEAQDEIASVVLMALEDEIKPNSSSLYLTYEELLDAFYDIFDKLKKVSTKNSLYKMKCLL